MSSNKNDETIKRDDEDKEGGQKDVSDLDPRDVDVRGGRAPAAPSPGIPPDPG